jgi:hypothetical protein
MTRLILTTDTSGARCLLQAGIADLVTALGFRFVWGPLPSLEPRDRVINPFDEQSTSYVGSVERCATHHSVA